ncbi:MAG: hypothetical protein V2I43_03620 [Parvularcula sp.]|jgi:hypothetical protein|nr:hypothetical protein [Parvularcula sp.]
MKIETKSPASIAYGLGAAVGTFFIATVAMAVAIYVTGSDHAGMQHAATSDFALFELTSSAAFSVASAVVSLVVGLIGLVTAAGATVMGLAVGALGVVGAVIVTVGMVSGPVLILFAIGILVKRRFFPDVI